MIINKYTPGIGLSACDYSIQIQNIVSKIQETELRMSKGELDTATGEQIIANLKNRLQMISSKLNTAKVDAEGSNESFAKTSKTNENQQVTKSEPSTSNEELNRKITEQQAVINRVLLGLS